MQSENERFETFSPYIRSIAQCKEILRDLNGTWGLISSIAEISCPKEAASILPAMEATKNGFRDLESKLTGQLVSEEIKKTCLELESKAQVSIDILVRNLYERTADIGFLATNADICNFVNTTVQGERANLSMINQLLDEYGSKYTVYDDIIILDTDSRILARLDRNTAIVNQNISDPIIRETLHSIEDYVESFGKTELRPDIDRALIYSKRIVDPADDSVIGVLCLSFRFDNEMEGIFRSLQKRGDKAAMLLLNANSVVIATSDPDHVPIGRVIEAVPEGDDYGVTHFAGREYLSVTHRGRPYQGYAGQEWYGHAMIPLQSAFTPSAADKEVNAEIIRHGDSLYPKQSGVIAGAAKDINLFLHRVIWNGQVMATNEHGNIISLKAILRQIRSMGARTAQALADSSSKLHTTMITSELRNAESIARLMIDIMDRNLYERSNDCRWWALTSEIRRIMSSGDLRSDDKAKITDILSYINKLYTVYTRLVIYDMKGTVIAESNLHNDPVVAVGRQVDAGYAQESFSLRSPQEYKVSSFEDSWLYEGNSTYIYNAAIRHIDDMDKVVGGIGLVFDSTPEFKHMLDDCLPDEPGVFGLFVERPSGRIIASTGDPSFNNGQVFSVDPELLELKEGKGKSKILLYNKKYYAVGCYSSGGYREFKTTGDYHNDVVAFVFIPIGEQIEETEANQREIIVYPPEPVTGKVIDLATFYIGSEIYAFFAADVLEAIDVSLIKTLPGTKSYIIGSVMYCDNSSEGINEKMPLLVIDGRILTNMPIEQDRQEKTTGAVIIIRTQNGQIGLLVDELDAIATFEETAIQPVNGLLGEDGGYIKSLANIPDSNGSSKILIILDQNMILDAARKR
ncbi:chemotaxis protein CheW [Methylobacter psychrophilus]|uniref:chemotaxis protein CheW n=1 Tax=Methylobacter psychrophilus TaxID=96941 RepID=UPI0021D4930E|nr:chemotaxis protein CheW [Methylobacter psychrophilus]